MVFDKVEVGDLILASPNSSLFGVVTKIDGDFYWCDEWFRNKELTQLAFRKAYSDEPILVEKALTDEDLWE